MTLLKQSQPKPARYAWLMPAFGILGVGAGLFALGWMGWSKQSTTDQSASASTHQHETATLPTSTSLAADMLLFDLGTVPMSKGKVTHDYTVTNKGQQPIKLTKLYTSCMCTSAEVSVGDHRQGPFGMQGHGLIPTFDETLAPGATATLSATFDPNAHGPAGVGPIDRTVSLESSDGVLAVRFTGNVTP